MFGKEVIINNNIHEDDFNPFWALFRLLKFLRIQPQTNGPAGTGSDNVKSPYLVDENLDSLDLENSSKNSTTVSSSSSKSKMEEEEGEENNKITVFQLQGLYDACQRHHLEVCIVD